MAEAETWRELLGVIISDPYEKQRIVKATDINPITLTRWVKGKSTPRADNLRPLLDALSPNQHRRLSELLAKEFPTLFTSSRTTTRGREEQPAISAEFYRRVIAIYTTSTPLLRRDQICTLVIQQLLDHLDFPSAIVGIILTACVRPEAGKKVRSLCKIMGKAKHYYGSDLGGQMHFMGSESQTGYTLMTGHPIVIPSLAEHQRLFPHQIMSVEESTATFPLLLADNAAGVITVGCTQQNFFTPERLDLIQQFTNLLTLAFAPEDFYPLDMIELGIMPPYSIQIAYTAEFQRRVTDYMLTSSSPLTRPEAEIIAKRQVEAELLSLARHQ